MTISSLNIKITVDDTKNDKEWVAQKKTHFWDNKTTIKFYQREKNQSNFQKLADFLKGVKPGREVATKYINELGLNTPLLNPKNTPTSLTDNDLNNAFQSAAKKMETRVAFESSEPLVSHQGTDKKVNIEINSKKIQNANTYRENLKANEYEFFSKYIQGSDPNGSQNKISLASIELAVDIRENRPQSFNTNDVAKAHTELTKFKTGSNGQPWFNAEFSNRLDRLISALGSKLEIPKQTAQTEKSVQNEAAILKKNEMKVFFDDFAKLNISNNVRTSTHLALVKAFDIRDNFRNQPTYNQTEDAHTILTNFRDNYKSQPEFGAISEKFDQLITVLEKKLSSTEKTATT